MSWTFCTSGAAITNAGVNVNQKVIASGGTLAKWSDEAEGKIEQETTTAWIDNYSGLADGTKNALDDVAASLIAMRIISFDVTGYLSRESDTLLNVNDDRVTKGMNVLKAFGKRTLKKP